MSIPVAGVIQHLIANMGLVETAFHLASVIIILLHIFSVMVSRELEPIHHTMMVFYGNFRSVHQFDPAKSLHKITQPNMTF